MKVLVKIEDYKIVWEYEIDKFEKEIKEHLKNGYQLDGHPFTFNDNDPKICQAMIKVTRSAIGNVN